MYIKIFMIVSLINVFSWAQVHAPDSHFTPGVLCTNSDPDFRGYDYPEKIERCNRNISEQEKSKVAANYGQIPKSDWPKFEFDHLIPLCAGGSNNIENLWPQPIDEAKKKDGLEVDICTRMKAGTLRQSDAVQLVHDWFANSHHPSPVKQLPDSLSSGGLTRCVERANSTGSSPLSLEFSNMSDSLIHDPRILITESEKDSEVISLKGDVNGTASRAQKPPLKGLILFTVKEHQDRFDVYLPTHRVRKFSAFLKLSFEDSYPKLIRLQCDGGL